MKSIQFVFDAIGTHWVIDSTFDPLLKKKVFKDIQNIIREFDNTYSRFISTSIVSKMAQEANVYSFSDHYPMITLYSDLYTLSGGLFTPLIGSVLEDAGYDSSYSLQSSILTKPYTWDEAIEYTKNTITIKKPVLLDFGAMGKGYLVDKVGEVFKKWKISNYCIDAGGDILYCNPSGKKLTVGLEHPENTKQVIGVVEIGNESICASSGNRRKWGKFHHIINPQTLASPYHILSVWVIAKNALLADALATALFFVDPKILKKHFDFEYLLLLPDYSFKKSSQFNCELYYN